MKSMLVFMAFLALASATAVKLEKPEAVEKQERVFVSTNNMGSFLTLNSTLLTVGVVVLIAVAAVALIAAAAAGGGGYPFRTGYQRHGQEHHEDGGYYGEEAQYQTRYKRFAPNDIASKMAQLEQAFKKYQVEEAECEMYIACEASQVQRIEENGPLARIVYDILSTFNRSKDGHKWDDRMEGLVQAFEFGTGAQAAGQADPCQPLRNKCFELHAKY